MVSSRVFMDNDVQPSRDYLGWLSSNSDLANKINAEVVTKPETATLEELFAYIKQETAKVAWFECTATIDDVLEVLLGIISHVVGVIVKGGQRA
ncbi:unnamed protein product [Brassica napus]|uniref:(rape) hypothetical protein n=1 Tax=Brassica napus TaxID=3708 RepID=A0A816U5P6_BRANA|nr:unnamed protein product [Brassica napus]